MDNSAKEMVIEHLSQDLSVYIPNSDETEHTIRCPYCGDSSNPSHGHLGVMIDVNDDTPMMYNCLKCGVGGLLTDEVLEDVGIYLTREETQTLKLYNKKIAKLANSRKTLIKTERFRVPPIRRTALAMEKLQYISNRLGFEMTPELAVTDKIITSLFDFMVFNEINKIPSVQKWVLSAMEKNYVGFLSSNNNCITFRCIRDNPHFRRYQKILLNPLNQDPATFFSIPSKLDLFYTTPLELYIAEGTFDILSVKHNLSPIAENQAFYAACGYSYLGILKHLARHGICTDINLHIYADKDKSDSAHMKLLRGDPISEFVEHTTLHRNAFPNEKDYGVSLDKIQDSYRQMW